MLTRGPRILALVLATTSVLALSACDTAEDRAEGHYQSALELIEAGDVSRGLIELRNVFDLNPNHHDARRLFADQLSATGDVSSAFQQYLILSELSPDDLGARVALARLAISNNDWELARRHGERAIRIAPDSYDSKLISALLGYQSAVESEDASQRRAVAEEIRQISVEEDDQSYRSRILVDNALREGDLNGALEEVDAYLATQPEDESFHILRLRILGGLSDRDGIREQLEEMVSRFPENEEYARNLIRWYVSAGNLDAAEAYIRERVASAEGDEVVGEKILLINFLRQARTPDAALAEVEQMIAGGGDVLLFRSLRAGLIFDKGDRDDAIAEMEDIVAGAGETAQARRYKLALARMHQTVGNEVAARQRVEEVLAEDETNVEAIKLRAGWLITEDKADQAIVELRAALQDAPEDPQIVAILAQAHLRNGNRELAREMLSLAVDRANNDPQYALPYARFLFAEELLKPAEDTLLAALRVQPNHVETLSLLGRIYNAQQDWGRAEQVENTLRRLDTEQTVALADNLRVARLRGQDRDEEAFELLNSLAAADDSVGGAEIAILREHLREGEAEQAEEYAKSLVEDTNESLPARMLLAAVYRVFDRFDEAGTLYRGIIEEAPDSENVWRSLFGLEMARGDIDAARVVLEDGLQAVPNAPNLRWALAGLKEQDGDIDGAIEIYEDLYEALPNSPIVANNLASLIATYRESDEELERAFNIARRLRGTELAAFQDTYGWIAYRRGQYEEALENLEPAAAGLQNDPIVQYHFGMALSANGRTDEAIEQLQSAIDLAGPADTRPQFDRAREEIERLRSAADGGESGN